MKKKIWYVLRILLALIALIIMFLGIVGIRDHLWHLLVIGALILFLTLFWNTFKSTTDKTILSPIWKRTRKIIAYVIIATALIDIGLIIAGAVVARSDLKGSEGMTMLILGTDVDGDQPGSLLKPRLDTAIDYLKKHPEPKVIVSGKGRGEYTEAEVMAKYLINNGVDEDRILLEDRAQSTPENFFYSKQIIQEEALPKEVLVVTNNYHQFRASIYAKKLGITTKALSAPTSWYMIFPLSERERYIIVTEWLGLAPDLVTKYQEIQ